MSEFKSNSLRFWMEIENRKFEIHSVRINSRPAVKDSFPIAEISLSVGLNLKDSSQVQPTLEDINLFYKYPLITIKAEVSSIPGLELNPGVEEGTYTIFSGDIISVSSLKMVTWGQDNAVAISITVAHVLRRITMGDISHYPLFAFSIATFSSTIAKLGIGKLPGFSGGGDDIKLKEYIDRMITWRNNGGQRPFNSPLTQNLLARGLTEILKESVDSNAKEMLSRYIQNAYETIFTIETDLDKLSPTHKVQFFEDVNAAITVASESTETSILSLLWIVAISSMSYIVATATKAYLTPMVTVNSSRVRLTLDDYTSCEFEDLEADPASSFISGGVISRRLIGAQATDVSRKAQPYFISWNLPDSISKGGGYMHYQAPAWAGAVANPKATPAPIKDIYVWGNQKDIVKEDLPVEPTVLLNFLKFNVIARRLIGKEITVVCPMRFDIAQGTILEVEIPVGVDDKEVFCGRVDEVSIMADSSSMVYTTVFKLIGVEKKEIYDILEQDAIHPVTNFTAGPRPWAVLDE